MPSSDTTQSLLTRRKLTRAVAEAAKTRLTEHLIAVMPLLRPAAVLGEHVHGGLREPNKRTDKALKELLALYERVASQAPFNLPREIKPPFNLGHNTLEITPVEYEHVASAGQASRTILVRSPLAYALHFTGWPPTKLRDLVANKLRSTEELQRAVLSYLTLHVVLTEQPELTRMFEALRFPFSAGVVAGLGDLPVTRIGLAVPTTRPSDEVLIQSAELTGMDAFEEVVDVHDVTNLHDPLRVLLQDLAVATPPKATT